MLNKILLLLLFLAIYQVAHTQTVLDEIQLVGDIDHVLPASSGLTYSNDESIVVFSLTANTAVNSIPLANLSGVGIDAYHNTGDGCGDSIYSLDSSANVAGTAVRASDVFTAAGMKVLDAVTAGIPDGIDIDAVSRDPDNCDLILSIDATTALSGIAFKPDDLIRWNSADGFSLLHRTDFATNIDALHYLNASKWLISLDTGKSLPDTDAVDEQVFEITSSSQVLSIDLINFNNSWDAAGINALWAKPKVLEDFMFADGFE